MTTYSKLNFVYRLQKWMDSVAGQTFLNYAYSWGASIVILGTLFKLTHLPGANFFLFLGMGTEVFVFFISAFDRPFDKTADGMDLDIHMDDEGSAEGVTVAGQPGVAGGGTVIINQGIIPPKSSWYGKISTFMFYVSVVLVVSMAIFGFRNEPLSLTILGVTAGMMIFALVNYAIIFFRIQKQQKEKKESKDGASSSVQASITTKK
jgi:hypothetical protein